MLGFLNFFRFYLCFYCCFVESVETRLMLFKCGCCCCYCLRLPKLRIFYRWHICCCCRCSHETAMMQPPNSSLPTPTPPPLHSLIPAVSVAIVEIFAKFNIANCGLIVSLCAIFFPMLCNFIFSASCWYLEHCSFRLLDCFVFFFFFICLLCGRF